jgi:hypothetical protein
VVTQVQNFADKDHVKEDWLVHVMGLDMTAIHMRLHYENEEEAAKAADKAWRKYGRLYRLDAHQVTAGLNFPHHTVRCTVPAARHMAPPHGMLVVHPYQPQAAAAVAGGHLYFGAAGGSFGGLSGAAGFSSEELNRHGKRPLPMTTTISLFPSSSAAPQTFRASAGPGSAFSGFAGGVNATPLMLTPSVAPSAGPATSASSTGTSSSAVGATAASALASASLPGASADGHLQSSAPAFKRPRLGEGSASGHSASGNSIHLQALLMGGRHQHLLPPGPAPRERRDSSDFSFGGDAFSLRPAHHQPLHAQQQHSLAASATLGLRGSGLGLSSLGLDSAGSAASACSSSASSGAPSAGGMSLGGLTATSSTLELLPRLHGLDVASAASVSGSGPSVAASALSSLTPALAGPLMPLPTLSHALQQARAGSEAEACVGLDVDDASAAAAAAPVGVQQRHMAPSAAAAQAFTFSPSHVAGSAAAAASSCSAGPAAASTVAASGALRGLLGSHFNLRQPLTGMSVGPSGPAGLMGVLTPLWETQTQAPAAAPALAAAAVPAAGAAPAAGPAEAAAPAAAAASSTAPGLTSQQLLLQLAQSRQADTGAASASSDGAMPALALPESASPPHRVLQLQQHQQQAVVLGAASSAGSPASSVGSAGPGSFSDRSDVSAVSSASLGGVSEGGPSLHLLSARCLQAGDSDADTASLGRSPTPSYGHASTAGGAGGAGVGSHPFAAALDTAAAGMEGAAASACLAWTAADALLQHSQQVLAQQQHDSPLQAGSPPAASAVPSRASTHGSPGSVGSASAPLLQQLQPLTGVCTSLLQLTCDVAACASSVLEHVQAVSDTVSSARDQAAGFAVQRQGSGGSVSADSRRPSPGAASASSGAAGVASASVGRPSPLSSGYGSTVTDHDGQSVGSARLSGAAGGSAAAPSPLNRGAASLASVAVSGCAGSDRSASSASETRSGSASVGTASPERNGASAGRGFPGPANGLSLSMGSAAARAAAALAAPRPRSPAQQHLAAATAKLVPLLLAAVRQLAQLRGRTTLAAAAVKTALSSPLTRMRSPGRAAWASAAPQELHGVLSTLNSAVQATWRAVSLLQQVCGTGASGPGSLSPPSAATAALNAGAAPGASGFPMSGLSLGPAYQPAFAGPSALGAPHGTVYG